LDDGIVLLAEAVANEVHDEDAGTGFNSGGFESIYFFITPRAFIFVVPEKSISGHKFIHAIPHGEVTFGVWDLEGEGTILSVGVTLVAAALTKDLASGLKPEHFKYRRLLLVLHDKPLDWFLVLET
jgi:hypothetical protein